MASDVQGRLPLGSLWKPEPRPKKEPKPLRRTELKPRQTPIERSTTPINKFGKAAKGRAADKRAILKRDPANHAGQHQCYIGLEWTDHVDLEHIIDTGHRPDLARDPRNHRKACNAHNIAKKNGTLTPAEEIRVQNAIEEVLYETEEIFDGEK